MQNELSKFVKDRRKLLGLTQEELAEKAGVGLRYILMANVTNYVIIKLKDE